MWHMLVGWITLATSDWMCVMLMCSPAGEHYSYRMLNVAVVWRRQRQSLSGHRSSTPCWVGLTAPQFCIRLWEDSAPKAEQGPFDPRSRDRAWMNSCCVSLSLPSHRRRVIVVSRTVPRHGKNIQEIQTECTPSPRFHRNDEESSVWYFIVN